MTFTPVAVLISAEAETLLHLDSHDNSGWLYTREEWEAGAEPRIYRRYGQHEGLATGERVELLPDMWIVKIDEREHWIDPVVLDRTNRIYGVYVFDRRQHFHVCSVEASYELRFLGSQYEYSRELTDEEAQDLWELIQDGDMQCDAASHWGVWDIDRMIANGGGFHVEVASVLSDDAYEEILEAHQRSEF